MHQVFEGHNGHNILSTNKLFVLEGLADPKFLSAGTRRPRGPPLSDPYSSYSNFSRKNRDAPARTDPISEATAGPASASAVDTRFSEPDDCIAELEHGHGGRCLDLGFSVRPSKLDPGCAILDSP